MDKISVSNLFPTNKFRPLDVNSLYNTRKQKEENSNNFNIDRLIKLREEKKKKIIEEYEKIYKMCLNKITLANNLGNTEVIYEVPDAVYGKLEYNIVDCIAYIINKLDEMKLDTMIFQKSIYISWLDLPNKT